MRRIHFTEQLIQEGDMIVAYCPELDVSRRRSTASEARANLHTALQLFIEKAAKMGTLKDILREAVYDIDDQDMKAPTIGVERQELV